MEIERKFLPKENHDIAELLYSEKHIIKDLYLNDKLRIRSKNNKWKITHKEGFGVSRKELEFDIDTPPNLFLDRLFLSKTRLIIPYFHQLFEVNIFDHIFYNNKPLILIELELDKEDQHINKPEWLGEEVTEDERFYGYNLYKLLKYKNFQVNIGGTNG